MPSVQPIISFTFMSHTRPETNKLCNMLTMVNGSLLSWRMKLECLGDIDSNIAGYLDTIHKVGLVHCDFHSRNIALHGSIPYILICNLGLSQPVSQIQPFAFYPLLHWKSSILILR